MAETVIADSKIAEDESDKRRKASPSGATDNFAERKKKFDDEGGDQPQAASEDAVAEELRNLHVQDPEYPLDDKEKKRTH